MKLYPSLFLLASAAILGTTLVLSGQSPVRSELYGVIRPFWKCKLPGGDFVIPIDRISNVSTHQYIVEGTGRVWEMVVSDDSSTIARFFYVEAASKLQNPLTGDQTLKFTDTALNEAAKITGTEEVWRRVVKEYPHATHAHTIEYRLEDIKTMNDLFQHLTDCWTRNKPGEIHAGKHTKG